MKINSEKLWDYIFNLATNEKVKFRVYYANNYLTNIFWDGENFNWESGMFTSGAFFNPLYDFEVIEEDKKIEKLDKNRYIGTDLSVEDDMFDKINELIEEIEKLKGKSE